MKTKMNTLHYCYYYYYYYTYYAIKLKKNCAKAVYGVTQYLLRNVTNAQTQKEHVQLMLSF